MAANSLDTEALLGRVKVEGAPALGDLLQRYSGRLESMIRLRLDRRLQGRVDVGDVVQETFLEATRSFDRYRQQPHASFYIWLRCIARRRLIDLHRHHLGAEARDPRREVSIDQRIEPEATSAILVPHLLATFDTPSEVAARGERVERLEKALAGSDPADREVLALRHFERLSNIEAAEVLGIAESAASKRYLRALQRLKEILKEL
jgi:RNA polymerase sigma-70 factor, ECF subfamily